jgi:hypothetical protein
MHAHTHGRALSHAAPSRSHSACLGRCAQSESAKLRVIRQVCRLSHARLPRVSWQVHAALKRSSSATRAYSASTSVSLA